MKNIFVLLLVLIIEVEGQDYFPLTIGNSWTYYGSYDTTYKRTYLIKDTTNINGEKYFVYGMQNMSDYNDTIRKDAAGNILKLVHGNPIMWFDFSKDSGDVYFHPFSDSYIYNVTIRKFLTVNSYLKDFDDCIDIFFDVPNIVDDEVGYALAPGCGIVRKYGAWSDDVLYTAFIDGSPLEINEKLESMPLQFHLNQNFPNPFNPVTTIKYALPFESKVTLKVYDILGNEIAVLVNEEKKSGNYEIDFQSAMGNKQLASGVYFYQLRAGNFVQTKKMMLLK